MKGSDLLDEIAKQICKSEGIPKLTSTQLAQRLNITQGRISQLRAQNLTSKNIVNLFQRLSAHETSKIMENAALPIVEFFPINSCDSKQLKNLELFSPGDNPYLAGIKNRLLNSNGIYIFHDSRGRALYAGKAKRQNLWKEMNLTFNRDRGDLQKIKRVNHPERKIKYREPEEFGRKIVDQCVELCDLAAYFSAYVIPDSLIDKFEAIIVRSFANDLLNKRMENF